jgi:hypothetical protein
MIIIPQMVKKVEVANIYYPITSNGKIVKLMNNIYPITSNGKKVELSNNFCTIMYGNSCLIYSPLGAFLIPNSLLRFYLQSTSYSKFEVLHIVPFLHYPCAHF